VITLAEHRERFEAEIRDLPEEDRNAARAEFLRGLDEERQRRIAIVAEAERGAQGSSVLRSAAGTVGAAGLHFANAGTLNYLPKIAGAVAGPESREKVETALAASRETNPIASVAGEIGGYVKGGTPAAIVSRAASKAATRALGAGVVATGLTRVRSLVEAAAMKPFLARASAAALENLVGGSAAITATNLVDGSDRTLRQRLADSYHAAVSPTNIGLSAGLGAWAGKYLKPVEQELKPLFEQFKRSTGKQLPAFITGDSAELAQEFDLALQTPGVANVANRVKKSVIDGTREMIASFGRNAGAAEGRTAQGAAAVRRLAGTEASVLGPARTSALTLARQGAEKAALVREGANTLSPAQRTDFLRLTGAALKDKSRLDPRGGDMEGLIVDLGRAMKRGPVSLTDLEALRQRLGKIGFVVSDTERGRVEAQRVYAIVDTFIDQIGPEYGRALKAGEQLRRAEEAFATAKVSNLDAKTLARFWSGDNPLERLAVLTRRGLPEDVAAAKGFLFSSLVRASSNADGMLVGSKLARNLAGSTMFARQVIDEALPGVADDLTRMAKIHDRARAAFTQNSKTYGRSSRLMNRALNASSAGALVAGLFGNPFLTIGPALGAMGIRWVAREAMRNMVDGRMAEARSLLSQGVAPAPIGPAAAAIGAQGGATGIANTAVQSAAPIGQAIGQIMGGVGRQLAPQEEMQP
jgi:hypothetical protein